MGREEDYRDWALENYEETERPARITGLIHHVFEWRPVSKQTLTKFDLGKRDFADIAEDAQRIGYPVTD